MSAFQVPPNYSIYGELPNPVELIQTTVEGRSPSGESFYINSGNARVTINDDACIVASSTLRRKFKVSTRHRPFKVILSMTRVPHVIGVMTDSEIVWDDGSMHSCPNPCGSVDVTVQFHWGGCASDAAGWWSIEKQVDDYPYRKNWIAAVTAIHPTDKWVYVPYPHAEYYIATDVHVDQPTCENSWMPIAHEIAMLDTILPIELHNIVGEYVGCAMQAFGPFDHMHAVHGGVHVEDEGGHISVYNPDEKYEFNVKSQYGIKMFDNHLIIDKNECFVFMDFDDMKDSYPNIACDPSMFIQCGDKSFKIGINFISYATGCAGSSWDTSELSWPAYISNWHTVVEWQSPLHVSSHHSQCAYCNKTCVTIGGFHVNVPAFGNCQIRIRRIGTRVAIVLTGKQGVHGQIHEIAIDGVHPTVLDAGTLLWYGSDYSTSFDGNVDMRFFGDCICVARSDGKFVTYAGEAAHSTSGASSLDGTQAESSGPGSRTHD
jgi:hypothetical protein